MKAMNTYVEVWNGILSLLKKDISQTALDTWFSSAELVDLDNNSAVICAANKFAREVIEKRFLSQINKALNELFCQDFIIKVISGNEEKQEYTSRKEGREGFRALTIPAYRFEEFKVAESNKFAYMVSKAVAENPDDRCYSPLFIYGPAGTGKTHLLCSIAMSIHDNYPGRKITYISGDEFTNRLVKAIQEHTTDRFRDEFRSTDVLLIDNVQFIVGKPATQEEFYNTFNALNDAGKLIIMASDTAPKEMPVLESRMQTRFESGIIADIKVPEQQLRYDIIKGRCAELKINLSESDMAYFASKKIGSIRQLEGLIKSLSAHARIFGTVNRDILDKVISNCVIESDKCTSYEDIVNESAAYFDVSVEQLKGANRARQVSTARQIAMYLMRTELGMTLEEIGDIFKRDHATVINSVSKIAKLSRTDDITIKAIRTIKRKISGKAA